MYHNFKKQTMTTANNTRQQIIDLMNAATTKIQIAVSWLTDETIINHLSELATMIKVEIVLSCDILNAFRYSDITKLQRSGATVLKRGSDFPGQSGFMHAKLLIIDNTNVYGGSYNFTLNASLNDENFDQYPEDKVVYWTTKFLSWVSDSKDYTVDFENPELLKKLVQEKFLATEAFNKQFALTVAAGHTVDFQNELNERDYLIKQEIKKEELRTKTEEMQAGLLKISENGVLSSSCGIKSQPHRFYGGGLITRFYGEKEKNCFSTALFQKKEIELKFPFLKCRIKEDTLICKGDIQPAGCDVYKVKIEFRAGSFPQVYIIEPKIISNAEIHIYKEGGLCLFYPGDLKWKNNTSIAVYTIPWVYEWIMFYELYKLSGKWEGDYVPHNQSFSGNLQQFKAA